MASVASRRRSLVLAALVFAGILAAHYLWLGLFPEQDPFQSGWAVLPVERSWWQSYVESQGYWLGYSYALSGAFAVVAIRRFLLDRSCSSRNVALGGVTFSGLLALSGCFLIGCCGSPMVVVWLNVFGAAFLPWAKPLLAGLTTLTIAGAWWWLERSRRRPGRCGIATVSWEQPPHR